MVTNPDNVGGQFLQEAVNRLSLEVAKTSGSTITLTKADACAIGHAANLHINHGELCRDIAARQTFFCDFCGKDYSIAAYCCQKRREYMNEHGRAAPAGGDPVAFVEMVEDEWRLSVLKSAPRDSQTIMRHGAHLYLQPKDSAPAGSGEVLAKWVEGARDYATGGNVRPDDDDEDQEQWDRLTEAAAILRKLQQGAE